MGQIRPTKGDYNFDREVVVCQICGMVMNNNDEFVLCPDCITPFHTSCWNNRGGCGNPKCESYVEKTEKNDTLQGRIVSAINEKAKKSLEAGEFENASALYKKALGYDSSNEEALIGTLLAEICVTSLENLFLLNIEFERFPAYEAIQNRLSNKTKSLLEKEIALRKERKRLEEEKQEKERLEREKQNSQADAPSQKPKVNTRLITLISAILAILISVSIVIGVSLSMQGSSDDDPPVEYSYLDYEEVDGGIKIVGLTDKTLEEVIIPNEIGGLPVTVIGSSAFYNCTSLASIVIPTGVTTIGSYAFYGCDRLTSITIPNSVTTIGEYAFYGCNNIRVVEAPATALSVIPKDNLQTVVINGGKAIGDAAFSHCTGLTSIEIPNSVTSIGDSAFYDCTSLASIEIPNSVTSISNSAFSHCTGLTSIEIPNSVTSIGDYAFYNCTGLTSIVIPNSVTYIGAGAFSCCMGLTSIEIPNSITAIGRYAFYGCTRLTIYCEAESQPSGWDVDWNSSNCPVVWGYKEN